MQKVGSYIYVVNRWSNEYYSVSDAQDNLRVYYNFNDAYLSIIEELGNDIHEYAVTPSERAEKEVTSIKSAIITQWDYDYIWIEKLKIRKFEK